MVNSRSTDGDLAGHTAMAACADAMPHNASHDQLSHATPVPKLGKKWKKWKPSIWGRFKDFLMSPYFKACAQLASGQFVISMFVFVNKLSFTLSCLASIFFYIGVILRQDQHVASFVMAGFKTAGCILTGATLGGIVLECIKVLGQDNVGFICLFGVLGLLVTSSVRVTADLGTGLINGVIYGIIVIIAVIPGRPPQNSRGIWEQVVVPFWFNGWLVALADILAGCFVLTSLARQDVKNTSAKLIAGIGHSLSRYASLILRSDDDMEHDNAGEAYPVHPDSLQLLSKQSTPQTDPPKLSKTRTAEEDWYDRLNSDARTPIKPASYKPGSNKSIRVQMEMDQEGHCTCDGYLDFLEEVSRPDRANLGYVPVTPCLRSLRPVLVTLRRLMTEAATEPPWADNCSMDISAWRKLADCMGTLALRNAALETLLEEDMRSPHHVLSSGELREMLGADVMPLFRLLFAQMAASCAALAFALREAASGKRAQARLRLLLEPSYAVLEFELASALHCIINAHWERLLQNATFRPTVQVRVLMYLGALCSGILESLADVERAALAALSAPDHQSGAWMAVRRALHIRSNKVDDPEDPSSPSSPARKQALQQTWMEMLSATSAAFQKGGDDNERPAGLHNSASAPTLYYGSSQRPLQVQAPHVLVERFSNPAPDTVDRRSSLAQPPQHDSMSPPAHPGAPSNSTVSADRDQSPGVPAAPSQQGVAPLPAQRAAASQPRAGCLSSQQPPTQEMFMDPATMLYRAEGRAGQTASVSAHDAQGVHTDQSSKASGTNSQKSLQQDRASRQQEHQQHASEASPRVRLTPHGIVHMGLSSASPTALRRWQSRRNHSGASPKDQNPQQRHAALVETTAESHVPTQHTASGSDQGSEGSARGPETAQAAHLPGSPRRPPARLRSSGASGGLPYSPLPGSLKAHPSVEDVQHTSNSLQAELELTGVGECTDINGTQMGANSSRNLQAEAAEDEELLSLRPTRDFVENFNQHTSFHRRKIMRSTKKGGGRDASGKEARSLKRRRRGSRVRGLMIVLWRWTKQEWGWAWPHVQNLCGYAFFQAIYGLISKDIPASFRSQETLLQALRSRRVHFFFKYLLASATVICVLAAMLWFIPGFHAWNPIYAMTTVAVVLSEKVDTTLSKGVLRIGGTVVGGSLGFVIMLHTGLATNPYALAAIVCAATFMVAPITLTVYRYAAFLTLITFHSLILCQYKPIPGNHGSLTLYYARITDIAVGVCVVLLFDLVMPWYAGADALERMGEVYREAAGLMEGYYDAFYNETRLAGKARDEIEEETGVAALEKDLLQNKIARPISELQISLQREQVLWKHGLLVIPAIVYDLLNTMMLFQDRLEAVEMMLLQKPIVSGRYTGYAFHHFVLPLDSHFRDVWQRVNALGKTVEAVLSSRKHPGLLKQLHDNVDSLQKSRVALRKAYIRRHHEFTASVETGATLERTPDDSLRYQSVTFSLIRALDKCVLTARLVADDDWIHEHVRSGRWQQRRLWLGLSSGKSRKRS